ncbi:hypothetical protein HMPREF3159_03320 [Brachybacterium sp. HMSC06H03]|uniref:tape measure protein n=1 Tax=Brachybacterium sp. HMSC06H03 TaxID=1581127 RepID=UPI0008A57E22|nr:tape measure protein [Brachybacterium sp. HMSC06H03]OFT62555.1 hypothetical protein HMPREF3159_03320 [Brachybacterium sp. HMSC06H03]
MALGNPTIATAAIGLVPTITGIKGNIGSQLAGASVMGETDRAGRSIGSKLGSAITSTLKTGLKVGGVVTGAIAGLTLKGGINRALGIEDAQAMMRGLGHDTETVDTIMGNALASVEGTAFGLDAAATSAAGAVAAGIQPGEQLEQTMKTVANVAAGAKAPMEEIGSIFNTVAAVGTAYTGDINMIAQRGIPIWQSLSDTLGVSQEEVKKMASEGKIDFETFEKAARDASGGVATAMGDTTRGSIANMLTSFSKLGADVVTRFMPMVKAGATGIQSVVQAVTAKLGPILDHLFAGFTPAATAGVEGFFAGIVSWIEKIDPQVIIGFLTRVGEIGRTVFGELKYGITAFGAAWRYNDGEVTSSGFPGFMERAGYMVRQLWDSIRELDFSSFSGFMDSLGAVDLSGAAGSLSGIGTGLASVGSAAPGVLSIALQGLGSAMQFLADHADTVVKLLPYIVAGFAAYKLATQGLTAAVTAQRAADLATLPVQIARNVTSFAAAVARNRATMAEIRQTAATNTNTVATQRATIAERARTIATKIGAAASKAAAVATRLLGAAIRFATGPIGLIITGITLLVAGLVWFFTQTETGKAIFEAAWTAIKNAALAVVDWFMTTAVPLLKSAWDGIAAGALWLYNSAILPAWNGIKTAIQVVGDWITGTLWPAIQTAWNAIGAAALWLYQSVILPAWNGIKLAIAVVVTAVLIYIDLMKFYFQNVIAPVALWLWRNVITPAWNGIKAAIGAVVGWIVNTAWPLIKSAWDAIAGAARWLYQSVIIPVWNAIKAAINAVVQWLVNTAWPVVKKVIDWYAAGFKWLYNSVILPVWNAIKGAIDAVVQWFQNTAWPLVNKVIGWLKLAFEGFKISVKWIWDQVKNAINAVVGWFRDTAWPAVKNVIDRLKDGFNTMKDAIKRAWDFVKDKAIKPVADWLSNTIKPKIDEITGNIKDAFDTMREGIKKAWDGIKEAAKTPIRFVIEDVYMATLRETFNGVADKLSLPDKWRLPARYVKFASGGVMPGYTPGRDVHQFYSPTGGRLDLSGGEAIMRPEWTRAVGGPAAVAEMNRKARRGEAFKDGGVWGALKGIGGDAWDWLTDQASTIAEAVTDPFGVLTNLAGKVAELIPGDGLFAEVGKKVTTNAGTMLGDWLKGQLAPVSTDAGPAPAVAGRAGGSLRLAGQLAAANGLSFTSGYRPGARTRRTGSVSYHALGRAHDYAAPMTADGKRRMMAFFNAMHPYKPTELLYSPAGNRQWRRWGAQAQTSGSTYRGHFNHVHVAFKDGGIMPSLYDQGGEIPPGLSVIANKTRRPEKVLPPRESEALTRIASDGGGGQHFHYSPQQLDLDDQIERRTRREFESMVHAAREVMSA